MPFGNRLTRKHPWVVPVHPLSFRVGAYFYHEFFNPNQWTLNGSDYSQVNDLTGNARHAVQGTAGLQPAQIAAVSGHKAADFTAANDDRLTLSSATGFLTNVSAANFFGVVRATANAAGQTILGVANNAGATRFVCNVGATGLVSTSSRRLDADSTSSNDSPLQMRDGVWHFVGFQVNARSGLVNMYLDDDHFMTTASWTPGGAGGGFAGTNSSVAPAYGRLAAVTTSDFDGDIMVGLGIPSQDISYHQVMGLREYWRRIGLPI